MGGLGKVALSYCVVIVLALYPVLAHACEANLGDRAANFSGVDLISHKTISLDDYFGKWVYVDFWASWCGPCRRELPGMIEQTAPLVKQGKLALLSVSCDNPDTLPHLRKIIREEHIHFPVLYDGGGFHSIPSEEWKVDGIPHSFLVNPQGVIVATGLRGDQLGAELRYLIDADDPPFGLRTHYYVADDGKLHVFAEVHSPQRKPLRLSLTRRWEVWHSDPEIPGKARDINRSSDHDYATWDLTFDDNCEVTQEFVLEASPEINMLGFDFRLTLPDTVGRFGEKGIYFASGSHQAMLIGLEYLDDGWHLNPAVKATDLKTLR